MYCIYCITNKINGKTYIGQHRTNNLNDQYMGSGIILHQAFEKYGIENFSKSILAITETKESINILEKFFIALYRSEGKAEYNMAAGGDGGFVLYNASEEKLKNWKRKIGENSKGHTLSKEARERISMARKKYVFSEETRRKIGEASRNRHPSEETRRKMSLSQKGKKKKPMSEKGKENIRLAHLGQIPWNKGKSLSPLSEEHKRKISLAQKGIKKKSISEIGRENMRKSHLGKTPWNKNKPTGYHWWNNGVENILSKECPEGFVSGYIGRKLTDERKLKISNSMKKYWENKTERKRK